MSKLLIKLKALTEKYINAMIKAPDGFQNYALGQRIPTKKDIRKAFMTNLRNIAEVAQLTGDQEALNYCQGIVEDESLEDIMADIKKASIKKKD